METINVKLEQVRVYETTNGIRYRLVFDNEFPAYAVKDGVIVKTNVNYIDFNPNMLIAQLSNVNEQFATIHVFLKENAIRSGKDGGLSAGHIQVICSKQEFVIERNEFAAGETYTDRNGNEAVHEFDGINTNIKDVKLDVTKKQLLENMVMKVMMQM